MKSFTQEKLYQALSLLENRIRMIDGLPVQLVVCGGSALIAAGFSVRTTEDVDIVALKDDVYGLIDPDPLPDFVLTAARSVAVNLNLPEKWLNTGPAELFRMGIPDGFENRLISQSFGTHLIVHFIGRIDQIHFKLYASADRGGYHIEDLLALNPTEEEIFAAARWSQTHDVSVGYTMILKSLLNQLGYRDAAARI